MTYHFYGWETADIRDERGLTPRDYYALLSSIWCADTCAPRMRKDWTRENKTLGQCSITAFLMQDIYGGRVLGGAEGRENGDLRGTGAGRIPGGRELSLLQRGGGLRV